MESTDAPVFVQKPGEALSSSIDAEMLAIMRERLQELHDEAKKQAERIGRMQRALNEYATLSDSVARMLRHS